MVLLRLRLLFLALLTTLHPQQNKYRQKSRACERKGKRLSCSSWHTADGFSGSSPSVPLRAPGSPERAPSQDRKHEPCPAAGGEQSWFTAANSGSSAASCSQQHLSRAFRSLRTMGTKPPGLGSVKKYPSSSRGTGLCRCPEQRHT